MITCLLYFLVFGYRMKHSSCLIYHFLVFRYQWNTPRVWYITFWCLDTSETLPLVFDILLLSVWILLIVFNILPLGIRISDETLVIVFPVLLLSAWISDETILRVFHILLRTCYWHVTDGAIFLVLDKLLTEIFLRKIGHYNFFY